MAGALIAFLPLTASVAATRPSAAVPVAGSSAIAAQSDDGAFGVSWPALAVILLTLAVAVWIALDSDGDGHGSLSRG